VDGRQNGGIQVEGWSRNEIRLQAKVQTWNERGASHGLRAEEIEIDTDGETIHAEGPSHVKGGAGWSVSYRLRVPHDSDLELETMNGGIHLSDLFGRMRFRAVNGGLHLSQLGGDVQGRTTNGGLHIELDGDGWDGETLDVETSNGGVHLSVPEHYSARLVTGTVNGRLEVDFPITVRGEVAKRIDTTLGSGGPTVRAVTTNGGVIIRER
jgi:hypothetical protein